MDIGKTTSSAFFTGSGGADAKARAINCPPQITFNKGLRIRPAKTNLSPIYLGTAANVTPECGYPLMPGEEHLIEVDKAAAVFLIAAPAGNSKQSLTVTGATCTLTVNGGTVTLAANATAADIQVALNGILGTGSVLVTGTGPFTVEFEGAIDVPLIYAVGATTTILANASDGTRYTWLGI